MFRNNYSVCVEALRRPPWQWHKLARGVTDRMAVTLLSGSTCFPNRHRTVLRQAEGQGSHGREKLVHFQGDVLFPRAITVHVLDFLQADTLGGVLTAAIHLMTVY